MADATRSNSESVVTHFYMGLPTWPAVEADRDRVAMTLSRLLQLAVAPAEGESYEAEFGRLYAALAADRALPLAVDHLVRYAARAVLELADLVDEAPGPAAVRVSNLL